jgi:hypothetical protein
VFGDDQDFAHGLFVLRECDSRVSFFQVVVPGPRVARKPESVSSSWKTIPGSVREEAANGPGMTVKRNGVLGDNGHG